MSLTSGNHDEYVDALFQYALGALPAQEAVEVQQHIAICSTCQREIASVTPVIGSFAAWPTDVLRPPESLWTRVAERIATDGGPEPARVPVAAQRSDKPEWKAVAPGVSCMLLSTDVARSRVSLLVRLTPGAHYPAHRHADGEELYMLDGDLIVDDRTFSPGDYRRAEGGSIDHRIWTETGCTCVLITSFRDSLLA